MEFDWDDIKSNACLKERDFDFATAAQCFMDPHRLISRDNRFDYGEDRFQVLGKIDKRVFFVTYTMRAEVIQIISARKANQREVKRYENQT
jgi:uncharacterized DUF497 family protein